MTATDMDSKHLTCLVTGATSGIGEATAMGLARRGATVVMVGRNAERGQRVRDHIISSTGNSSVELMLVDFASLAQVRDLAAEFTARHTHLHRLVNNAGVVKLRRETSIDGYETMFAVNHLAHFLLTHLLLDTIVASPAARIVNVSSHAHHFGWLESDDWQSEKRYSAMRSYGGSKLANVLFTYELARRLEGTGVTANCLHPGGVASRLGQDNGWVGKIATSAFRPFALSPEKGARTSLHVTLSPELDGVTGHYFAGSRERNSSKRSHDRDLASALWRDSERMVGISQEA
ncbi:SDR family oxidoreductase [Myxococcota bacterium]|nr:SDR family oxidoreductase [Myxococcota bacterium]